jgi:hypothetical protein
MFQIAVQRGAQADAAATGTSTALSVQQKIPGVAVGLNSHEFNFTGACLPEVP